MLELTKKKSEKSIVGLEIEAGSVAAAEVRVNGTPTLTATAIAPMPSGAFQDGEVVDPAAVTDALKRLFEENKLSKRVRLGIANQRVVVRTLQLPSIDDPDDLAAAVRFEAEERIPMPIDQAVLDHRVIAAVPAQADEAPKIEVVVVAARRDMVAASLRPLRDAGLEPVGVDLSAFALIRALGTATDRGPDAAGHMPVVLHCNIGDSTNLAVAHGRSCLFTRVASAGIEQIADSLAAETGLPLEHARLWLTHVGLAEPLDSIEGDPEFIPAVRSALERGVSPLFDEIRLSLDFYAAQDGVPPVERILVSGPGAAVPGLAQRLEPVLGLPTAVAMPAALGELDPVSSARLTLSYGLALED
jgi:type IV pilus assembly protein PilM